MKQPDHTTLLLGHPLIAWPGCLVAMGCLFEAAQDSGWWLTTAIVFVIMTPIARLAEQRQAYMRWKREWDAMAGTPAKPIASDPGRPKRVVGIAMLGGLGLFFAANASDPIYAASLVYLVFAVGLAALVAKFYRRTRTPAGRSKATSLVTICVRKPLLAVPRIQDAYRALPPHCQALFAAEERQRRATIG